MIKTQQRQEAANNNYREQDSLGNKEFLEFYKQQQKGAFQYQPKQQSESNNTTQVMHQASLSSSFSLNQISSQLQPVISINTNQQNSSSLDYRMPKNDTLDSNGNIIRGRKIDSPQLVVVKELRDLEDQEENGGLDHKYVIQGFSTGSGLEEDLLKWNTRDKQDKNGSKGRTAKLSKSQEKQRKFKEHKMKIAKEEIIKAELKQQHNLDNKKSQHQQVQVTNKVIKSSRDIRSSMGFNELLNQLDKDISIQQSNQQDFKNRTTHDLLKLELSGIRRQNSSSGQIQQHSKSQQKTRQMFKKSKFQVLEPKSKSKSRERKTGNNNDLMPQPKSILKKNSELKVKEQIFQYALNNVINDITPEKNQGVNATSFLQSEHGRCITSTGVHQSQQFFQQNGRTLSQQNIGTNNVIFSKIKQNILSDHMIGSSSHAGQQYRDQSSPDRSDIIRIQGFKPIGNIDKLIRENIKKIRTKEDGEKIQKQQSEDKLKKKRELIEYNNNLVRKINKEKTYRKQSSQVSHINYQQSQDFVSDGFNFQQMKISKWDEKFKQLKKEQFIQKTSQSQKIDLQKIKESTTKIIKKQLNIKNHRKSYGLEFMDIKKEIQDELKTIDLKIRNEALLMNETTLHRNKILSANNTDFSMKKIKTKSSKDGQFKENTMINEFKSERELPHKIDKIVVIKKSKIRKFMKMKKKEKIKEQYQNKKEEILKTVKMQENISKLNEFCKKKLTKNFQKRRNATIQHNDNIQDSDLQNQADVSKISGRRLIFDYSKNQHQIVQATNERNTLNNVDNEDDSSRLSTDFYEEYFRLLNSIKKEQQNSNDNMSKTENYIDVSTSNNVTRSNILKSPQNKSMSALQISSSMTQKQMMISPKQIRSGLHKQAKTSMSQNKPIGKKSKSKGNLQETSKTIQVSAATQLQKQNLSSGTNGQLLKIQDRAESAPLLAISNLNKKKISKQDTGSKKKSQRKIRKEEQFQNEKIKLILNNIVKIQRTYREHLDKRGFYQQSLQTVQQYMSNTSDFNTNMQAEQDTIQRIQQLHEEFKQGLDNSDELGNHLQLESGFDDEDQDEQEEDEEEEDDEDLGQRNMIIINQQSQNDDKKVVYLSNINSCSLPQTPKIDDTTNQMISINKNGEHINKVFEYKPGANNEQNQLFSQTSSINDHVYQSISQKPSLESAQESVQHVIDDKSKHFAFNEEVKATDYGMRLMAGSESLLREFKMNTPQQQQLRKDHQDQKDLRNLTSHNSQSSLNNRVQNHQQSAVDSKKSNDHTSQSSQSLFERNSFQQFTMNKLQQMTKNNEFMNLIQMREKALEYRQEKESKFIKKMYKNQQLSPRTYNQKKQQLEKWVRLEKEEIQKTKKQFQEEWQKTIQMIEDTQKNVDQMREKMKIQIDNNKYHQQLFNSQSSRNSSSSYITTQKIDQGRKSILEQEEFQPLSQRSLRLSNLSSNTFDAKLRNQKQQDLQKQAENNSDKLIDFLEHSWQHKDDKRQSNHEIRQGIYIEDQRHKAQSSQLSDQQIEEIDASPHKSIKDFISNPKHTHEDERPLQRSRSEQDLSDLINKNKISLEELQAYTGDSIHPRNSKEEFDEDSFRILESERDHKNQQLVLNLNKNQNQEIKIQENLFDQSSHRNSKGEYPDMDMQSNDSLLNESELNNYFQEQKFSIEDFKSLDKRKLINQEVDDSQERQESQIFLDKYDDSFNQNNEDSSQEKQHLFQAQNDTPSIQMHTEVVDTEPFYNDINDLHPRASTPDIQTTTAFLHHQQALLFQNTKPGENIKIADILKKTQSMTDNLSLSSFMNDSNNSQAVFQNAQINQSMQTPNLPPLMETNTSKQIADQITEDILQYLLQTELKVPKRQIELQTDYESTQHSSIPQQLQALDNQDVFIIDNQFNEKEQRREIIEYKQRMMIESDLMRIENYINEVIASLQQHELFYLQNLSLQFSNEDLSQNYHRQFLQVLTAPIKRNELDMLNSLQTSEIGSYEHFETAQELSQHPILPVDLYLDIERLREESQLKVIYQNMSDLIDESSIIQESVHIHNKAIFDALNESLMKFRPYGIQGEPMSWSNKNRRLQTKVDTSQVDTERLFFMVKQDVMRWCQTFSGCHPSTIFTYKKQELNSEQDQFDDEIFQETRERRLAQMLASEVVEQEHQWLNYEFEEAQVKIDLSDMILEHLVEEAVIFLNFKQGVMDDN